MSNDDARMAGAQLGPIPDDAHFEGLLAASNARNKAAIFEALRTAEVRKVLVTFAGSGGSSVIEGMDVTDANGRRIELPNVQIRFEAVNAYEGPAEVGDRPLNEAIEALAMSNLAADHDGWENGEGGYGEVLFEVAGSRVRLDYCERRTEITAHSYTF